MATTSSDGEQQQVQTLAEEAQKLAVAVEKLNDDMSEQVVALSKVVKHDRQLIKGLVISVTLDILLSIGIAFIAITATSAKSQAEEAQDNARIGCLAANETRIAQIQLWDYVLSLASPSSQTPAQKAQIEQFRIYVAQVFAQRDCDNLASIPPLPTVTTPSR
jgi:hypothetical protein